MALRKKSSNKSSSPQASSALRQAIAKSNNLVDKAWNAPTREKARQLAHQALEVFPECGEAYHLLSEIAPTAEAALPYLEKSLECATCELGEDNFREMAGHFWGFHETRPYMSARRNLARCLMELGRIEQAIEHYQEMLKLNPNDNQGNRYELASALLLANRLDELDTLLKQYPNEQTAEWAYSQALFAYKLEGDSPSSRLKLQEAQRINEFVPLYLVHAKPIPEELPQYYSLGEESEAIHYVVGSLPAWRSTPGAISWLREILRVPLTKVTRDKRLPPWKQVQAVLQQLPMNLDIEWEIDLFSTSRSQSGKTGGWTFMIVEAETGLPLLFETWNERPHDREILRLLIETMRNPNESEPYRPRAIHLTRGAWNKSWAVKLKQVGVECILTDRLPQLASIREDLERASSSFEIPPGETTPMSEADIEKIPQCDDEEWQITFRQLPTWVEEDGQMIRPTVCLVYDKTNDKVVGLQMLDEAPSDEDVWHNIGVAFHSPAVGEPRRPKKVQLSPREFDHAWIDRFQGIGIDCEYSDDEKQINEIIDEMTERVVGAPRVKPITDAPGVTTDMLGGYFEAAADFFRAAPWRHLPGDVIIRVETEAFSGGPWYVVIMGQHGLELGLSVYEDLKQLQKLLSGRLSYEENAKSMSAISLLYGEKYDIAPEDLDAIDLFGWPVATKEAYPSIMRVKPGLALRSPLAWEIELLEALLRALPEFVRRKNSDSCEIAVNTSTRDICLKFSRIS